MANDKADENAKKTPADVAAETPTIRDLFAAHALAGLLAAGQSGAVKSEENATILARRAWSMADAMLKTRP